MAPAADCGSATMPSIEPVLDTSQDDDELSLAQDLEEIGETDEVVEMNVRLVQGWIRTHGSLNCRQDPAFILRFLRMQKHQVQRSCSVLENYVLMRKNHPQWFQNLDVRDEKLQELVKSGYLFALPGRDPAGRRVIFSVARALDPTRHSSSDALRAHILTFEALLEEEETQLRGFTYIIDCSGISLSHLSIWSPSEVRKLFSICEKNLPMRHKDINLLAIPFGFRTVFEFAKSLLSDKIKRRFCLHSTPLKLQLKLGEGAGSLLPLEYGGTTPLATMTEQWADHLDYLRPSLLKLDSMDIKETKISMKPKVDRTSIWSYLPTFVQSTSESV